MLKTVLILLFLGAEASDLSDRHSLIFIVACVQVDIILFENAMGYCN